MLDAHRKDLAISEDTMTGHLAFIGFGEAGQAFASGLGDHAGGLTGTAVRAFDVKPTMVPEMEMTGVVACPSRSKALTGAAGVWCLVTADQAVQSARECADYIPKGAFWFDGNSCSPGSKTEAAAIMTAKGVRYVDVAIMAPVHPLRASVPLLISGPYATAAAEYLHAIGMNPTVVGDDFGQASAIKMMRSVMIKGIEALTAECVLGARRAGVEDEVLSSLMASDPGFDWPQRSGYNFERMAVHGARRAAEMREVARTLRELSVPDRMALATADWQDQIGALSVKISEDHSLAERADTLLQALTVQK